MKKRISLIFCVVAAVVCLLSVGAAATTYAPDNDGLYTVVLDMEPNCEYSLFAVKGVYDQTNYIEAYRAAEDSDILYFEQKNSESDGSVAFGPFAPAGYYDATLILGGTNLSEPIIAGYLSADGISNSASIELSGIEQSYTVEGMHRTDIVVEVGAQVLDSFGYPSVTNEEVSFELLNNADDVTIDGSVITISKTAKQQVFTVKAAAGDAVKTAYVAVNRLEPVYTYMELYADKEGTQKLDSEISVYGVSDNYPEVSVYAKTFSQYCEEISDEYIYTYGNRNVEATFKPKSGRITLTVSSINSAVSASIDVVATARPDYSGSALELYNLIAECRQVFEEDKTVSSESGKDVFPDETWTTQAAVDSFSLAIDTANTALNNYGASGYGDDDYADEVTALTKALGTYKSSFKAGVRVDYKAVSLDVTEAKLLPKGEVAIKATTTPASGTTDVLTWTSSDDSVATVTANKAGTRATVKAVSYGKATITVTTRGGLTATAEITVVKKTTEITITPYEATATYGSDPVVLTAQISPKDHTDVIEWTVEKPDVADIKTREYEDAYGNKLVDVTIIPKSAGKTDITVSSSFGKHSATSEVTVVMPDWNTAAKPTASVEQGSVLAGTKVALSTSTANAKIYYTLDGSEPTVENGRLYTTPIEVSKSFVIKAIAAGNELYSSDVAAFEYSVVNTSFSISDASIQGGQTAVVELSAKEFESIKSAAVNVEFDAEYLSEKAVVTTYVPDGVEAVAVVSDGKIELTFTKEDGFVLDGAIARIELAYKEDAPEGDYSVSISYNEIVPVSGNAYQAASEDSVVIINNYIVGDANDDGKISLADVLMLKQYLAGNENAKKSIVLGAADTDADGDVDNDDLTLLSRYCVGWNVTLG